MKQIKFLVSVVVLGLLLTCTSNAAYSANPEGDAVGQKIDKEKQKRLRLIVNAFNEECPMDNGEVRYDKIELISNNEVGIFLSFVKATPLSLYSDSELKKIDLTEIKKEMVSLMQSPSWSVLCECEPILVLCYSDNTGRELFRIRITPEDYQNKGNSSISTKRQILEEVVTEMNKSLPSKTNATIYEKVELLPNDDIEIFITYTKDTPLSRYSDTQLKALEPEAKKILLPLIKSDEWSDLRSFEATFVVTYRDKTGRQLFRVRLTPDDYK